MKTIGIIAQKGGQGKSFIAVLLSHFLVKKKKKVVLIDSDFPQLTIDKLRKDEEKFCEQNKENAFSKKAVAYIKKYGLSKILSAKPHNLSEQMDALKEEYEYILVDFTGSLNVDGFDENLFSKFQHIVVPTRVDPNDIRSNFEFYFKMIIPLQEKLDFKYHFLFNMVENHKGDLGRLTFYKDFCKEKNIHFFETILHKRKRYAQYGFESKTGELSTIIPPAFDEHILDFYNESYKLIF